MNNNIDNLQNQLNNAKSVKTKAKKGLQLATAYKKENDFEQTIIIAKDALQYAESGKFYDLCFEICSLIGSIYSMREELDSTLKYFNKALIYAEMTKKTEMLTTAHNQMGIVYSQSEKYENALSHYFKATKLCQNNSLTKPLTSIYSNIAGIYSVVENQDLALEYLEKALVSTANKVEIAYITYNIGITNLKKNDYKNTHKYLNMAYIQYQELNQPLDMLYIDQSLANLEISNSNYEKAIEYINRLLTSPLAKDEFINFHDEGVIMMAICYLNNRLHNKKLSESEKCCNISINEALKHCNDYSHASTAKIFYELYMQYLLDNEKYSQSKAIFEKYQQLIDNIIKQTNERFSSIIRINLPTFDDDNSIPNKQVQDIPKSISIIYNHNTINIQLKDILYIETRQHYLHFYLSDNDQIVKCFGTLKEIQNRLDNRFIQCHRAFLVNMDHILSIGKDKVKLKNKTILPCKRDFQDLKIAFLNYRNKTVA